MIALAVIQLAVIELGAPTPAAGGGFELRFPAPPGLAARHARLRFERHARAELNGSTLAGGETVEFDVMDPLGKSNRLFCPSDPGRVKLLLTPRVYAAAAAFFDGRAEVVVRNTLDNTANVAVTIGGGPSATAAIPPNTSLTVVVRGRIEAGPKREVWVDKDEEALEGGYRYSAFF